MSRFNTLYTRRNLFSIKTFYAVEYFGVPVLLSSERVDPHTVPDNLYVYDIGTDASDHMYLCESARDSVQSVISAQPIRLLGKNKIRKLGDYENTEIGDDHVMSLQQYCKEHGVELLSEQFSIAPTSQDDYKMFYSFFNPDPVTKARIGHVRLDFGYKGMEFWHTWWGQDGNAELNNSEFQSDLDKVVNRLRRLVLKDLASMKSYCSSNGDTLKDSRGDYGFVIETEKYIYYLRCSLRQGDYNGYLNCFRKDLLFATVLQRAWR